MHLEGHVPRSVMEALNRVGLGAQLSLKPRELQGGSEGGAGTDTSSFSIWLVILCMLFHPGDLQSTPGTYVKNSKGDGYHMTTDLALFNL